MSENEAKTQNDMNMCNMDKFSFQSLYLLVVTNFGNISPYSKSIPRNCNVYFLNFCPIYRLSQVFPDLLNIELTNLGKLWLFVSRGLTKR